MATYDLTPSHASNGGVSRLMTFVVRSAGTLSAWNDARKTRNALNSLTDKELDDIGLCRGDIDNVSL